MKRYTHCARTVTEQRDRIRIATKIAYVISNPSERSRLIYEAVVAGTVTRSGAQET